MAFDNATRNKLQRFVTEARQILSEEFTRLMQQDYGLDPSSGNIADLESLSHLDDQRLETARILREILDHYLAATPGAGTKDRQAALDRLLREQAFTILNRLAALRMMEARGLLIESVAKGYQSKGFQLYERVAGSSLGETGDTYRIFLFSIFDMFTAELRALFDRAAPYSRLFPREPALLELLEKLNAPELEPLWAEDETIGWIYQYFNSKEERKAMRDASQAPRNSRELAVRNQFFTPRYVVEFLTDNTLGRLWFNATEGATGLRDKCQYLLVRPDLVVLNPLYLDDPDCGPLLKALTEGQFDDLPAFDTTQDGIQAMIRLAHCVDGFERQRVDRDTYQSLAAKLRAMDIADLTTQHIWDGLFLECRADRHGGQGEIYNEPWFAAACDEIVDRLKRENNTVELILPTPMRDPRTLKLLDPACGSMHFGLYAFDLFLEIYAEAWEWEQTHGPDSLDRQQDDDQPLRPLAETYENREAFLRDVPRLIIEHNIHGVDIDARAAQIAALALWLRAQKAWHQAGLRAADRPIIGQGHVVAAVAPPAELDLRQQIMQSLPRLDAELFEKTLILLKGLPELGVLLRIEKELPLLIRQVFGEHGGLFEEQDMAQWQKAEHRLRQALTEFAEAAEASYQGRLFAQDALQGLRLMDLCGQSYDVVLMNPPFGALSNGVKSELVKAFPRSKNDLLAIFVERGLEIMPAGGRLGAITSRTCFFLSSYQKWREEVVLGIAQPEVMADLGHGVMDDAMVEAAAYVLEKQP